MKKRIISALLTVLMLFSLFPVNAMAEEAETSVEPVQMEEPVSEVETVSEDAVPAEEIIEEAVGESSLIADELSETVEEDPNREETEESSGITSDEPPAATPEEVLETSLGETSETPSGEATETALTETAETTLDEASDTASEEEISLMSVPSEANLSAVTVPADSADHPAIVGSTTATLYGTFSVPASLADYYRYGITLILEGEDIDGLYSYAAEELNNFTDWFEFEGLIPQVTYSYQARILDEDDNVVLAGELCSFTTTAPEQGVETVYLDSPVSQTDTEDWHLYQITFSEAGSYEFSAAGSGQGHVYGTDGVERDFFDSGSSMILEADAYESFWISCSSEGDFTFTVSVFSSSEITLSVVTDEVTSSAIGDTRATLSGTFSIPYDPTTRYTYGMELYLGSADDETRVDLGNESAVSTSEMDGAVRSFSFTGLIPKITYTCRAYVSNETTGEFTYGVERSFTTAEDASSTVIPDGETRTVQRTGVWELFRFTAPTAGAYPITVSGSGTIRLYDADGTPGDEFTSPTSFAISAAEGEVVWIYCYGTDSADPLTIAVNTEQEIVRSCSAVTDEASATDTSASLSGEFSITGTGGEQYAYGIILYLNGTQVRTSYRYTSSDFSQKVEAFPFNRLIPGLTYTYRAVIREADSWDMIAEGDEESFTTAAAGSGVRDVSLNVGNTVTESTENSPLRYTAAEDGVYQLAVSGNGLVFLNRSDGGTKETVITGGMRLFTLEAGETVYIYCSGTDGEGLTLTLSTFVPSVTDFSAATGDATGVTGTAATISGTFSIPFTPDTIYSYGITISLNGTEVDSSTLRTNRETDTRTEEFAFTQLLPGKRYTYKAVIFDSETEEVKAEGEEKSFETATAGTDTAVLVKDVPVTPETPFVDTLYTFTPASIDDFVISAEGRGVVRVFNQEGSERASIQNGDRTILHLTPEEMIWLYCRSESSSNPLVVTVSSFVPTVTASNAETGEAEEITETTARLSGVYNIHYAADHAHEYGIIVYQNGTESDGLFTVTEREEIAMAAAFDIENLIPGTTYTYQAVIRNYETGLNESTGTERTFRTADTGDSIEEIALDTERRLSVSEGERYLKFTAAKSGFYKISASGTGTVTVYDPEGAGQSFVGADREMIVEASSGDVLWIRCASEDDGDPLTVTVTLFTAKVETPVAVTGAAADVTESSASLSGIFTVPKTDASYSCGIMLLAGEEEADRDSIETGVELAAAEKQFTFTHLIPGATYTYRAFIEDNDSGETVAQGEEKKFTTPETTEFLPLSLDVPAEISAEGGEKLYRFQVPTAGNYTIMSTGQGYAAVYRADGSYIDSLYAEDTITLTAESGERIWARCSASDPDQGFSLTVSVFTPTVTEYAAVTGDSIFVNDTEATVEGIYSIPYDPDGGIRYGAELYAGGVLVDSDLYHARTELDGKTAESSFYGLIPGVTYTYKAVIRNEEGTELLAEGAEAQFTTHAASEETVVLRAGRNEVNTDMDADAEVLHRFTAPSAGIWVFRLAGDGEAAIYGSNGLLKAGLDPKTPVQLTLEKDETVWLNITSYDVDTPLVLYINSDEYQITEVPDGLWAIVYEPDGITAADFVRMDTGAADRRLTTQSDGDGILNTAGDTAELTSLIDIPYFDYTGKPIMPVIHLYNGTELLDEQSYSLSYKNNTKASCAAPAEDGARWSPAKTTPQIIIKLKGNYSGSRVLYFNIYPLELNRDSCDAADFNLVGTGKLQKATPSVTYGETKLNAGTDYILTSATGSAVIDAAGKTVQVKDEGSYTVTLRGKGNYYGETSFTISVKNGVADLSKASVKVTTNAKEIVWTGRAVRPDLTVTATAADKTKITEVLGKENSWIGQYFRAESGNNIEAGKAEVTIVPTKAGEEYFTGSKTIQFTILAKGKLGSTDKTVNVSYTGEEQFQNLAVYDKNKVRLREGYDYITAYADNINAGKATVLYTGINGYAGSSLKKTFTIDKVSLGTAKAPNSEVKVTAGDTLYLKGGAKPDTLTVVWGTKLLTEGTDYTVKLANNKAAADSSAAKAPTVTISGKGNFSGTAAATFTILPKPIDSGILVQANDILWSGKPNNYSTKVTLTDTDGKALAAGTDYEKVFVYTLDDGTVLDQNSPALAENTVVTVTVKGMKNYSGEVSAAYRVLPKGRDISKATFAIEDQVYSGKAITITDQGQFKMSVINKTEALVLGRDFEIVEGSYLNNVNKGTAKVTIHGIGDYGGYRTVSFKIVTRDAGAWWQRFFD